MKTFKDLEFKEYPLGGIQATYHFDNGYGISVVQGWFSYGGREHLYECAVLKKCDDGKYHVTYDSPVADDVLGYCDENEVSNIMNQIQQL